MSSTFPNMHMCKFTEFISFVALIGAVLADTGTAGATNDPTGHLEPLGKQRQPIGGVDVVDEFLHPKTFFEEYTNHGKPVLFHQVLENMTFPAYDLWTDEHLAGKYGKENVNVEMTKKEDRNGKKQVMPLSEFVKRYQDENIHMIQDEIWEMAGDVTIPRSLHCGGFLKKIKTFVTSFSNGNTTSVLHYKKYENIYCLMDGETYIILINKKYKELVEVDHWNKDGGYSDVDVESVDLKKFPQFPNIPWYKVHLKKGDCLYIPHQWYHHVRSKDKRTLAVSIQFVHLDSFNDDDCKNYDPNDLIPKTMMHLEEQTEFDYRTFLAEEFEGYETVNEDDFISVLSEEAGPKMSRDYIRDFFRFIDANNDTKVTTEELLSFDIDQARQSFPEMLKLLEYIGNGTDNTDENDEDEDDEKGDDEKKISSKQNKETSGSDPVGHMKPLGQHRPPESTPIDILDKFPTPKIFHEKYIKMRKPVLFRGVLKSGIQPAYNLWTDEFLRKNFGDEMVYIEIGKKETRKNKNRFVSLSEFLEIYKKDMIYMVQEIPASMTVNLTVPTCLLCGGFQNVLNIVRLWLSSGDTKSILHSDSYDNINCLLDGEKYLVLVDKKHSSVVESHHWHWDEAYSGVDPEKVDMYKFPNFRNIPWYEVQLKKGDCFYLPSLWYHYIHSKKGRNFAANFWFTRMLWFNDTDCEGVDQEKLKPKPLSEVQLSKGDLSYRMEILAAFEDTGTLTETSWINYAKSKGDYKINDDVLKSMFRFIDEDKSGVLSHEELLTFNHKKAMELYPGILPNKEPFAPTTYSGRTENEAGENDVMVDKDEQIYDGGSQEGTTEQDERLGVALDKFQETEKLRVNDEL